MTQNSPLESLKVSFILDAKSAEKFFPHIVVLVFEFFGESVDRGWATERVGFEKQTSRRPTDDTSADWRLETAPDRTDKKSGKYSWHSICIRNTNIRCLICIENPWSRQKIVHRSCHPFFSFLHMDYQGGF